MRQFQKKTSNVKTRGIKIKYKKRKEREEIHDYENKTGCENYN